MITVDADRCAFCGGCVSVCPVGAINLVETRVVVSQACTECGFCLKACPVGALSENGPPLRAELPSTDGGWTETRLHGRYDLVVVGAGPGGSTAAWHAARHGLSVLLLEKRQEIGSPVRCAEGVPHTGLAQFLEPDPSWIAARIDRSKITVMAGGKVVCEWRGEGGWGYVLERRLFDRSLCERASVAGARVLVKAPVLGRLRVDG